MRGREIFRILQEISGILMRIPPEIFRILMKILQEISGEQS